MPVLLLHAVLAATALVFALRRSTLTGWIVAAMLCGTMLGLDCPQYALWYKVPGDVFLRLIKSSIGPLLFSTLVVGVAGHADLREVGRMGLKSIVYFELMTTLALVIGLFAINLTRAGVGTAVTATTSHADITVVHQTAQEIVLHAFPENIAKAVADGAVLQVVVFSLIFGMAMAQLPEEKRALLLGPIEGLSAVMFKYTGLVMLLAPLGVGSALAYTISTMGLSIMGQLLKLLLTLYGALVVFVGGVLLPVAWRCGVPLVPFFRAVAEPVSLAFATTSSEAALPIAMERLVELGVPRRVVAFVMPTGYSFNLDGTTLYLALASVFVAQAAAIPMDAGQQAIMVLTLMLTSKGVAGVPRASLVILLGTASSFGLPEWPIMALLGIDSLMDMARTAVNVAGNCLASVIVAIWEGIFTPNYASPLFDGHRPL